MGLVSSGSTEAIHRISHLVSGDSRRASSPHLPAGVLQSLYQNRVLELAARYLRSPPSQSLEATLRKCIAFCYGGGEAFAPSVRCNAFADNPNEHQLNVPVYSTLLCTWGVPGFEQEVVRCTPIVGTDVQNGRIVPSNFWSRPAPMPQEASLKASSVVLYRDLLHQLLDWFVCLDDGDARKQLLVNQLLQLHEACFNCIGRHKEVFELCIYDLMDSEQPSTTLVAGSQKIDEVEVARRIVQRHAARFLDRHKRNVLQATILSPLKFLFQNKYEVYENIDNHGASFWVEVLTRAMFPGLQMPYDSILGIDKGWTWAAVDFLPMLQSTNDSELALKRFSQVEQLGQDWRVVTVGLKPPARISRKLLPGLCCRGYSDDFERTVSNAQRKGDPLRLSLLPYAARFAEMMMPSVLIRCFLLSAVSSENWDTMLGPALATLLANSSRAGPKLNSVALRERLCSYTDAGTLQTDTDTFGSLLLSGGVPWFAR